MMRLCSFLTTVFATLFIAQTAQAADALLETDASVETATDWSGAYVGVHVGLGNANYDGVFDSSEGDPDSEAFASDFDLDGIIGGLQLGYNKQSGDFVYGIEADISGTDFQDSAKDRNNPGNNDFIEGEVNWLATLRGRAGFAMDNVLVYGTAGIAYVDASYTANDVPFGTNTSGTVDFNDVGYVVGGGVELMKENGISFRLEGLYYGFNDRKDTSTLNADSDVADFAELENAWVVRAGISIKLVDFSMK